MATFDQDALIRGLANIPSAMAQQTGPIRPPHMPNAVPGLSEQKVISLRSQQDVESAGADWPMISANPPDVFCDNDVWLGELLKISSDLPSPYGQEGEVGVDACAWYISFHHHSRWGIYIPLTGLLKFASRFTRDTPNPLAAVNLAFELLLSHEGVHYGIDIAVSQLELLERRALYIPNRNALRNGSGYIEAEEKISNAAKLVLAKRLSDSRERGCRGLLETCRRIIDKQPPGYKDAHSCASKLKFHAEANLYLHEILNAIPSNQTGIGPSAADLSCLIPLKLSRGNADLAYVDISRCPIYIIEDLPQWAANNINFYFIGALHSLEESTKFLKELTKTDGLAKLWQKTKQQLNDPVTKKNGPNLDLKKWSTRESSGGDSDREWWSVRVGGATSNKRAHLYRFGPRTEWVADSIGNADKMGHHKQRR